MNRQEAIDWFETQPKDNLTPGQAAAYAAAIEALHEPKYVALKEGDVAILEFKHRLTAAECARLRKQWQDATKTRSVVLDDGARLAGAVLDARPDEEEFRPSTEAEIAEFVDKVKGVGA
jgi:hypothetical protein